jgi:deazaflavin-dependent oxidoreductase (nitroreductase family)
MWKDRGVAEPLTYARANPAQRLVRRFASSGPGSWIFVRVAHRIDRPVYRWSKGRRTFASMISGLPIAMVTTTGAKSGKQRTVPVLGLPTEDGIAVIASNFGQRNQPGWYYNLRANPEGEVAVDGTKTRFRAVEAEGELRERIWKAGLEIYPGWTQYEKRASHRDIAVFVLRPV